MALRSISIFKKVNCMWIEKPYFICYIILNLTVTNQNTVVASIFWLYDLTAQYKSGLTALVQYTVLLITGLNEVYYCMVTIMAISHNSHKMKAL